MTFTDDDLARLKEDPTVVVLLGENKIQALLSRLEAAEKVASYTEKYAPKVDELQGLIEAWRKVVGK